MKTQEQCGASTAELAEQLAALRNDLRRAGRVLGMIAARQVERLTPGLARERGVAVDVAIQCAPRLAVSAAGGIHAGVEGGGAGWSLSVKRAEPADGPLGFSLTLRARPTSATGEAQHA